VMMIVYAWAVMRLLLATSPARQFGGAIGTMAALLTMFLSRIRVSIVLAAAATGLMLLFSRKAGLRAGRLVMAMAVGMFAVGSALFVLAAVESPDSFSTQTQERDKNFFMKITDPDELIGRLFFFYYEIDYLPGYNPLYGFGAGTGGSMRSVIGTIELLDVPKIDDTGIALIYHELGLLGLGAFVMSYVWITVRCGVRMVRMPQVPSIAVSAFAVAFLFLVWFLLKSHAVIANGLSNATWMASLGITAALLDRTGAAPAGGYVELPQSAMDEDVPELSYGRGDMP